MSEIERLRIRADILDMLSHASPQVGNVLPIHPEPEDNGVPQFDEDDLTEDGLTAEEEAFLASLEPLEVDEPEDDEPEIAEPQRTPRRVRFRIHPPPEET